MNGKKSEEYVKFFLRNALRKVFSRKHSPTRLSVNYKKYRLLIQQSLRSLIKVNNCEKTRWPVARHSFESQYSERWIIFLNIPSHS